jgi:DNA polymerase I-like protein with 3'-5' exonuclease and polymerase domains/uracil-DNA glycosylase
VNLIEGCGYDQADLMIVADYCRKSDEATRKCLSGFYTSKLEEYLRDNNYNLNQVYRTCVVKLYEKGLGVGSFAQDRAILNFIQETNLLPDNFWLNHLLEEIRTIKPSIIIVMGEYALRILTGKQGIANYRGSVLHVTDDIGIKLQAWKVPVPKVVATEHPSVEHYAEEKKYLIRMDVGKAVELLFTPNKPIDAHEVTIARTTNDYLRWRTQYPDSPPGMVTDIETHLGFITAASFTFDGYKGLCIPVTGSKVDAMDKARMLAMLARDLANPAIGKCNQNMAYDKRIYQRFGFLVNPVVWDTQLAASVVAPEFLTRLGFLTSIYCDGAYHKDEGKEFDPSRHSYDQLYEYCAKDSIKTFQIWKKQEKELAEMGGLEFFNGLIMPLFDPYFELSSVGILQDKSKQKELAGKYEGLYTLREIELRSITGRPLNLNSPSQVGEFMESMGFPISKHKTPAGKLAVNTDVETMKKMRSLPPEKYNNCQLHYNMALRFINLILLLRRIDLILQYVNVGVHPDGRIRTSYRLGGTASGRTSASQTPDQAFFWEGDGVKYRNLGGSFQTVTKHGFIVEGDDDEAIDGGIIGKDVREMYRPDPGWVIVEIDRSQAEARVVDLLAEDYAGLEEYGKVDKHCKNAAIIFPDYTYDEIRRLYKAGDPQGEYMRQLGKKGVHATNYDMGDFRLSSMANISMQFAKKVLTAIHTAKPWIRANFHAVVEAEVRRTRRMDNPYGRPRMFFKKLDSHGIKVAYSWYPQSTISDGTKQAFLRTWQEMDRTKAYIVAENHDSLTALVRRGYVRTYMAIVKKHLEAPVDFRKGTFYRDYQLVIPTETTISRTNWGHMKTLRKLKP